jgi:hypothetical protein
VPGRDRVEQLGHPARQAARRDAAAGEPSDRAVTHSTVAAGSGRTVSATAVSTPTGASTSASTTIAVSAASPPTHPWPGFDASGLCRSGNAYGAHTETRLPTARITPSIPGTRPSVIGK